MKRSFILCCAGLALALAVCAAPAGALTIGGLVRQPLNLGASELAAHFENTTVRATEVGSDRQFHGAFVYRGVPLKTLLSLASVRKEDSNYQKPFDLAVVVKNREGKTAVLSVGEIFYRNGGEILVAFAAEPLMPGHTNCGACHGPSVYQPALDQLTRKIAFPKLVVTGDFFTDRNLEEVISIDVIEMPARADKKQMKGLLSSPKFSVSDGRGKAVEITDLAGYRRVEIDLKYMSEGNGYHGVKRVSGVPLKDILDKNGMGRDAHAVVLASSVDDYRILISDGELRLNPAGERILVADSVDGVPIKEGKFTLFFPDDIAYDRTAKALSKIEVVRLEQKARLFVIGVGCAGTSLVTLKAVSYMGRSDVFVASDDVKSRFSRYIGDKPVLFDPFKSMAHLMKKDNAGLTEEQVKEKAEAQLVKNNRSIGDALKAGKNVAILEYGDPTVYPPWPGWLDPELKDRVEVVPGLSAFNASNAMLDGSLTCRGGSIVLTTPRAIIENVELAKAVSNYGDTLAVFMGVREIASLVPALRRHYPPGTPVYIVYKAGYSNSAHVVKTTLGEAVETAAKEKETHLAMIYIVPCLK